MKRAPRSIGIAVAVVAVAMPALAEERERGAFVVDASVGAGYSLGAYTYEGRSNACCGPVQTLRFEVGTASPAVVLAVAAGGRLTQDFALGLIVGGTVLPAIETYGGLGGSSIDLALIGSLSVVGMLRPEPAGFEALVALGVERAKLGGGGIDLASADNIYEHEGAGGPVGALRVGYAFPSGFGVGTTGSVAWLAGEHSTWLLSTFVVQGTLSTW